MQLMPVASATPDGDVRIAPEFLPTNARDEDGEYYANCSHCGDPLCGIEWAEDQYRKALYEAYSDYPDLEEVIWNRFRATAADGDVLPLENTPTVVSSRQAVFAEADEVRRISYSIGDAVRNERSRSHKLKKSRLRLQRQRR